MSATNLAIKLLTKTLLVLWFALGLTTTVFAQNANTIDSLQKVLSGNIHDTTRIKTLLKIAWENAPSYPEKSLVQAFQGLTLALNANYENLLPDCYNAIGTSYFYKSKYEQALNYYKKELSIAKKLKNNEAIATSFENMGLISQIQGNHAEAMTYYLDALKIDEFSKNKSGIAHGNSNIGLLLIEQNDFERAIGYLLKAEKIFSEINDKSGLALCYTNIGMIKREQKEFTEAIKLYNKTLEIYQAQNNKDGLSTAYINLGVVYTDMGNLTLAENCYLSALKNINEINNEEKRATVYTNLSDLYFTKKNYELAIAYGRKSVESSLQINSSSSVDDSYEALYLAFKACNKYDSALKYHELFKAANDSVFNITASKEITKSEAIYQNEKKEKEIALQKAELAVKADEARRKDMLRNGLILGLGVLVILLFLIYRFYQQKKKNNYILTLQNEEIKMQKQEIESKNKMITDSIEYAKLIQEAMLTPTVNIEHYFADAFVFYKPRDIVSGDFYWFHEEDNLLFLAIADCTGHGVAGAFMSMIGNTLLNKIVKENKVHSPAEILYALNSDIIHTLQQSNNNMVDNGMDITLMQYNRENQLVNIAIAGQKAIVLHNHKINILQGGIFSIGGVLGYRKTPEYHNHTFKAEKGMQIYSFTDGFVDQFQEQDQSKFGMDRFVKLIESVEDLTCSEKLKALEANFNAWKGSEKQTDDVLVIGISF